MVGGLWAYHNEWNIAIATDWTTVKIKVKVLN